ncbi:hypothetical protein AB0C81_29055 [Streptomyces roseoverticillatus]|uniref:hypothetical protein n=1 Tax=Streptomyces roseoverticillatus TaxID=66429 RepID=UPI003404FBDE
MLGWEITIWRRTPEELDRNRYGHSAAILARWEDRHVGALNWLTELVEAGKAEQLTVSGYPSRWTTRAGDALQLLVDGPPNQARNPRHVRLIDWKTNLITDCPADQVLTIEAWDQS